MEETPKNDLQEDQPEQFDQYEEESSDESEAEEVETPDPKDEEIAKLREESEAKDKQISDLSRIKREAKKKVKSDTSNKTNKQSDELDYGQRAYLNTKGIDEADHDFVNEQRISSNLPLEELLNNGYFQSQLKERVGSREVKEATPSGTRGSAEPSNTKVQHWLDKGELPPDTPENNKLRQDVVNARIAQNANAKNFTSQSVVEG